MRQYLEALIACATWSTAPRGTVYVSDCSWHVWPNRFECHQAKPCSFVPSRQLPPNIGRRLGSRYPRGNYNSNMSLPSLKLKHWRRSLQVTGAVGDGDRHYTQYQLQSRPSPLSGRPGHLVETDTCMVPERSAVDADDRANRIFALARILHLRRHRSEHSRALALRLFRECLLLKPSWRATDTRYAVDCGINNVFAAFSCRGMFARECGKDSNDGWDDSETQSGGVNDVARLRSALAGIGYTAGRVQARFGRAGRTKDGRRLPGPYYLRKAPDHTQVRHRELVFCLPPGERLALDASSSS